MVGIQPKAQLGQEKSCDCFCRTEDALQKHAMRGVGRHLIQITGELWPQHCLDRLGMTPCEAFEPGRKVVQVKRDVTCCQLGFIGGQLGGPLGIFGFGGYASQTHVPNHRKLVFFVSWSFCAERWAVLRQAMHIAVRSWSAVR